MCSGRRDHRLASRESGIGERKAIYLFVCLFPGGTWTDPEGDFFEPRVSWAGEDVYMFI